MAFIHDEMVVALPATEHVRKDIEAIRGIAVRFAARSTHAQSTWTHTNTAPTHRTMQELMGEIPVSCSLSVSREWSKHPVELDWDTLLPVKH